MVGNNNTCKDVNNGLNAPTEENLEKREALFLDRINAQNELDSIQKNGQIKDKNSKIKNLQQRIDNDAKQLNEGTMYLN